MHVISVMAKVLDIVLDIEAVMHVIDAMAMFMIIVIEYKL